MAGARKKAFTGTVVVRRLFQTPDGQVLAEEELRPEQMEAFRQKLWEVVLQGWVESERERHRRSFSAVKDGQSLDC